MLKFFKNVNATSKKIMSLLLPDNKSNETPLNYYLKNQDEPIDVYFKTKYEGYEYSLLKMCVIRDETELLKSILNSSYMQNASINHDWQEVFDVMISAAYKKEIFLILSDYYLNKLSKHNKEDVQPFVTNVSKPEDNFAVHFNTFPKEELWRLFIDGEKQKKEKGWLDFELRENGYMAGMLNGFDYLHETIGEQLSTQLLKNFHAKCSSNVNNLESDHKAGYFRNETKINFGLIYNENASIRGFVELVINKKNTPVAYIPESRVRLKAVPEKEIEIEIDEIIAAYNQQIKTANNDDDRLYAIIELVSNLERAHPFGDANCRTICVLVLNRELIRNGFSPVILEDPNRFDGFNRDELYNEIVKGMKQFHEVKQGNIKNLGISTDEISKIIEHNNKYGKLKDTQQMLEQHMLKIEVETQKIQYS